MDFLVLKVILIKCLLIVFGIGGGLSDVVVMLCLLEMFIGVYLFDEVLYWIVLLLGVDVFVCLIFEVCCM